MTLNQGVALARDEAELTNEIWAVAAGGSGVILLTGDIDLNSTIDIGNGKTITLLAAGPARTIRRVGGGISISNSYYDSGEVLTLGSAGERGKLVFDGLGVGMSSAFFTVADDGALIIDGSTEITGGVNTTLNGGAILVSTNGALEMRGGKIANCRAQNGGAVTVDGGSFTIRGGEISGNAALNSASLGGAVYVCGIGSFTLEGGLISGNTATGGGAVTINEGSTFTMEGGLISGNTAIETGGGVHLAPDPFLTDNIFTMRGGEISGNTALNSGGGFGGGVCVTDPTSEANLFFMEGGLIKNNTADQGGGVYVDGSDTSSAFIMTGGLIGANTAIVGGGGVHVFCSNLSSGPTFAKRGGTIAGDNTAPAGPVAYVDTPPRVRSAEAGPTVRLYWSGTTSTDPLDNVDTGPNWN
jgi:hypothetical protein